MQQYETPEALRAFLRLCLDPGHNIKRTPVRLVEVMPEKVAEKVAEFAPHLGELQHAAQDLDAEAEKARRAYADALAAWIHSEEPKPAPVTLASKCYDCGHTLNWHNGRGRCSLGECTCDRFQAERYVIGRNGVFATLYDWQEHRLVVDNATEEHCRRVRDKLLAAPVDGHEPAPRRSMPLMEAVTAAYDAAVEHATKCGTCWPGMRLAEMCPDGQREALAYLDHIDREPECANLAGE